MTTPRGGIVQLDLTRPLPALGPPHDDADVLVVLRVGGLPLGQLLVAAGELPMSVARLRQLVAAAIAPAVGQQLLGPYFDPPLHERRPSRRRASAPAASPA